jgi:hypothetical protein
MKKQNFPSHPPFKKIEIGVVVEIGLKFDPVKAPISRFPVKRQMRGLFWENFRHQISSS